MEYELLIMFVVGIAAGVLMTIVTYNLRNHAGTLRIDRSNPDKEIYRLDVNDLDVLAKKKFIWLKVDNKADLSQK